MELRNTSFVKDVFPYSWRIKFVEMNHWNYEWENSWFGSQFYNEFKPRGGKRVLVEKPLEMTSSHIY